MMTAFSRKQVHQRNQCRRYLGAYQYCPVAHFPYRIDIIIHQQLYLFKFMAPQTSFHSYSYRSGDSSILNHHFPMNMNIINTFKSL